MTTRNILLALLSLSVALNILQWHTRPQPQIKDNTEALIWQERYKIQKGLADVLYQRSLELADKRDTVYQERIVLRDKWRDRISVAPKDSVVFYRLDSCTEIGSKVLVELEYAKEELVLVRQAYDTLYSATAKLENANTSLQVNATELQKEADRQRRWKGVYKVAAIVATTAAVVIYFVK